MAEIIFVTGGCRSGKSTHARTMAESRPGPRTFLATCPVLDPEMARRVSQHQQERAGARWETLEETIQLESILARPDGRRVFLLDCLSLWVNNLLHEAGLAHRELDEADVERRCREIVAASAPHAYALIVVSNEVGMGIVPDNTLARQYRDLLGRANQVMAEAAGEVVFMVAGIPLRIKG